MPSSESPSRCQVTLLYLYLLQFDHVFDLFADAFLRQSVVVSALLMRLGLASIIKESHCAVGEKILRWLVCVSELLKVALNLTHLRLAFASFSQLYPDFSCCARYRLEFQHRDRLVWPHSWSFRKQMTTERCISGQKIE